MYTHTMNSDPPKGDKSWVQFCNKQTPLICNSQISPHLPVHALSPLANAGSR